MSQPSPSRAARRIATASNARSTGGWGAARGRIEPDVAQPVPAALEGDEVLAPEPSQHVHLLFHPAPAVTEVLVQGLELDRVPADADAEPRPSPVEDVELGPLLGDERGLALGEDEDRGRELDRSVTAARWAKRRSGSWNIRSRV